jgi:murein L,D-transpeptidase YcbB/YkuD
MKKVYILSEEQIKRTVNTVITEQSAIINLKKSVQCFLNKKLKLNLVVDGKHGEQTKKAIELFQKSKKLRPDGVWGQKTTDSLDKEEYKLFQDCLSKHGDVFDKLVHKFKF